MKFWDKMIKRERTVCLNRIKLAEKHGIGKMAMEEKARLLKLNKKMEDRNIK